MSHPSGALSRRDLLRLSAAAGAGLLIGGCDVGGKSTSGGKGSGEGTITALFMQQAAYSDEDVKGMTADFMAANPKIKVNPEFVAYDALHDKIVTAAPAGTYDVVLIDVIWPAEFGTKKIVTDVTDQFPAAWKNDMLGGALSTARYRDRYYGVPWILDTKYLFYNTEMLSKAGVDAASLSTWDGVMTAAKAMKDKKVVENPIIWSWKQAEALICDWTQLLGAFGGKFLSDDGKSAAFDSGGGVQALEFMKKSLDDKLTNPNSIESLEEDVRKIFSEGGAAIALNWTYMFAEANKPDKSKIVGKVGVAPTPAGTSGGPGVNGSMALCVTSGSKNQQAAWSAPSPARCARAARRLRRCPSLATSGTPRRRPGRAWSGRGGAGARCRAGPGFGRGRTGPCRPGSLPPPATGARRWRPGRAGWRPGRRARSSRRRPHRSGRSGCGARAGGDGCCRWRSTPTRKTGPLWTRHRTRHGSIPWVAPVSALGRRVPAAGRST